MSAEEKRKTILGIYQTTKEVYTEKEIIALASKAGVNENTITEVNNYLIDENLVDKSKIGGSNYFWSFPGKKDFELERDYKKILEQIETAKERVVEAESNLADAKRGREEDGIDGEERAKKLTRLEELCKERKKAEQELEVLKQNDPKIIEDLEKELKLVTEAANRWTDNIFACKSYLTKKRGFSNKEAYRLLQINSEFDYPE